MRRLLLFAFVQSTTLLLAQTTPSVTAAMLPDSPGTVQTAQQSAPQNTPSPCNPTASASAAKEPPCTPPPDRNPYQRFLNSAAPMPLTPRQKGLLAFHNFTDTANLFTITADAGFNIAINSHSAYGPGWKGFGRNIGYSLVQDATGEFVSTVLLDSLLHQDPHYHRIPTATVPHRLLHAISHTVISQHDDGRSMPNYSTLLTYPISAEIANLYVPGVATNAPSTAKRVAIGLATNPVDDLITEFLPDLAKRIHIRVVFLQQVLNNVSSGQPL